MCLRVIRPTGIKRVPDKDKYTKIKTKKNTYKNIEIDIDKDKYKDKNKD